MRRLNRDRVISLVLIAPSLVAVGIFVYGMMGWTGFVSTTKWNSLEPDYTLNGLANYQSVFDNTRFQFDLRNTVVFTILFVGASLIIGLLLANLLDRRIRAEALFRSLFLFPMAISFIVTGVVWKWLLSPSSGYNLLFGLDPNTNKWFTDPKVVTLADTPAGGILKDIGLGFLATNQWGVPIALLSLVIAAVWQMSGFVMALYLAGCAASPRSCARRPGSTARASGRSSAAWSCRC